MKWDSPDSTDECSAKSKFIQRGWVRPWHIYRYTISQATGLDHPLLFRLSLGWLCPYAPSHPPCVVYLAETLLSSFSWPLKNPCFLGLAFCHAPGQLWTASQAIACPVTEYVQRGEEEKWKSSTFMPVQLHGTHTALCSGAQTGPESPSKVPPGSACGVFPSQSEI